MRRKESAMKAQKHNKRSVFLQLIVVAAAIGGSRLAPAAPILEYAFNETGTTAPSTGTETTSLTLYNAANAATDLHGTAGSGVSGVSTDRCLDFSSAQGMGSAPGVADVDSRHSADLDAIDTLKSFTVSGWYKTSVPDATIGGYAVLFDNNSANNGFRLSCAGPNLALYVDDGNVASTGSAFDDKNRWVFFAVTYDGTLAVGNVRFYRGYRTASEARQRLILSCVYTGSLDKATLGSEALALRVGNSSARNRPFKGYLDNIRIFGSKTDATGALGGSQLETVRAADVADVPDSRKLLEYTFNETGTNAPSSGLYLRTLALLNTNGVPKDFHGGAGSGVRGLGDDRALDFTSATA